MFTDGFRIRTLKFDQKLKAKLTHLICKDLVDDQTPCEWDHAFMKRATLVSVVTLVFSPLVSVAWKETPVRLKIPFSLHNNSGSVEVVLSENKDPEKLGYVTLFGKAARLDQTKSFPVINASVTYGGIGYNAMMGWIQILTYSKSSDKNPTIIVDHPPQMEDSNSPFCFWGPIPTLFDAPSMFNTENKRARNVTWRADSFLVASPDALMSKIIFPVASFSWGYKTDGNGKVSISDLEDTKLRSWKANTSLLREKYPKWTFKE